jgi:hypothetical protein
MNGHGPAGDELPLKSQGRPTPVAALVPRLKLLHTARVVSILDGISDHGR